MLPDLLTSFRSSYPHITLGLEVGPRGVVWPMLAAREVDLVVAGRPPDGLDSRVRAVSPNTLVVVGPPSLPGDFDPGRTTWLQRETASGIRATAVSLLDTLDVAPPPLALGSHGAVVAGADTGLGVTLVSRQSVRRHLEAGSLVELRVPGTPMQRAWHVVSQPTATAATNLLVRHLLRCRELGWRPADRPAGDD